MVFYGSCLWVVMAVIMQLVVEMAVVVVVVIMSLCNWGCRDGGSVGVFSVDG